MRLFKIMNILSVDVALGAVIGATFFAKLHRVEIFLIELVVLMLTVWIVYTADHLMDAYLLNRTASTNRHQFHQSNFKTILGWLMVVVIVNIILVCFIRRQLLLMGEILAIVICIYFIVQRKLKMVKEILSAILYTSGVLLLPLSSLNGLVPSEMIVTIIQFGLIVLTNLLLFASFDEQADRNDEHSSFAISFGSFTTRNVLVALFIMCTSLSIIQLLWLSFAAGAIIILALMNGALFFIFINRSYFEKNERYRLLGDGIFFMPALYILIL